MNVLFLTQIIPYPPDAGPKVKTWHVLRYLNGRGHKVILASFMRPEEEPFVPALREVCAAVHTVPIRRSRLDDVGFWLRSHLTGRPFLIERDDLAAMRALVARLLAEGLQAGEEIDVIHADQLTMTQFALPPHAAALPGPRSRLADHPARTVETNGSGALRSWPRVIFDAHNAVWTIVERMRQNAPAPLRPVAALEAQRIKRYEGQIIHSFDHTLAVTEPDRQALLQAAVAYSKDAAVPSSRISVVPIAVDTITLAPATRRPGSLNIFTLGTLHYPPNADGIRWFLQEVFPLVQKQTPGASLTIVGKNPPQDFLHAAALHPEAVQVTGYVPDLAPYIEQAALMVVPVRAGGGMRVRILEGFARGIPVVTTTVGLEGIDAQPGEEVLLADTPADFAREVVRLLHDQGLQAHLSSSGRRLAEVRYDWQVVLKQMDEVYCDPISIPTQTY
jgi:glycosyltransferase involved in cell wall biosynthesis